MIGRRRALILRSFLTSRSSRIPVKRAFLLLCLLLAVPAFADVLTNANFNSGTTSLVNWSANPTASAATGWNMWQNSSPGTFTTQLFASTLNPAAGNNMVHVVTPASSDGIYQAFASQSETTFSVWIYVVSGTVGAGIGNGGNTTVSQFTTGTGQWELLTGTASNTPVSEMIIYASGGGADFYVENASIPAPEPGSMMLLGAGLGSLLLKRKRGAPGRSRTGI